MTRSPVGVLLCILGLLSTIGLAGCGGTETGNPSGPGGGGGDRNPAITLAEEICATLTSCFGEEKAFTEEDCIQAIAESDTLGSAFGVEDEPPPGFGEVIDKVESSDLSADEEAVEECLNAIDALECEDWAVQAVEIEEGFTNVEEMIPEASCSQIFSVPREDYGGVKDDGAGLATEEKLSCTDVEECDDGNPCTLEDCHEGFCDYQSHPIDEDLDGYVSHICGGPDCDDQNEAIHPGVIESPYDDEICFDELDNDCNDLMDEADTGCFRCDTTEDCDDSNPCTQQACLEGRCAYTNNPGPCDDGDACTVDVCFGGTCTGDPLDADGDGYVDDGCGGDDCDDSLPGVHPGVREGPPADPSCGDGMDNDCDGLTDTAELACQGGNKVIELTAEEELAPTWTDLEIALTVGTFQENEVVRISYVGDVNAVYVTTEDRVWVEAMSLTGGPVSASILIPLGTLIVDLEKFLVASKDPENLILDPDGYFSANIRLRVDVVVSVHLGVLPIIQDYPMSILSEDMSVSGQWMPRGDTDGDGRDEFDLLVAGTLTYEFPAMDVPILGEVAATMSGDLQLGFRGEAL